MACEAEIGQMPAAFSIEPEGGAIRLGQCVRLTAFQRRRQVAPLVASWQIGERDFGNGYAWIDLGGLAFGGQPANVSLCFAFGRLEQASWGVRLPDAAPDGGWPTPEAIDEEIAFVRAELARQLGLASIGADSTFGWGVVWSLFDPKAGLASHGLRYGR